MTRDTKVLEARAAVRHAENAGALVRMLRGESRSSVLDEAARKLRLLSVAAGVPITAEAAEVAVRAAAEAPEAPEAPEASVGEKPTPAAEPGLDPDPFAGGASFSTEISAATAAMIPASEVEITETVSEPPPVPPVPSAREEDPDPFAGGIEVVDSPPAPLGMRACPRCREEKAPEAFGLRVIGGKTVPQSYCKACRSAHARIQREKARAAVIEARA